MNEQNPEIQQLFAEEQLKVNSDETVDFPFQMDNLNQEDVHQRYQDMGMNHADAESHTNCVDFTDQVREDYIPEETELVRWTTQDNLDNKGNYYTLQESNADPGKLGIPNSYDAFEVYKTTITEIKENLFSEINSFYNFILNATTKLQIDFKSVNDNLDDEVKINYFLGEHPHFSQKERSISLKTLFNLMLSLTKAKPRK